jgi:DNA-binding IclR family transcriptional regulator
MLDYTIPNLKNACRILDYLGRSDHSQASSEIADHLEIPRSTALRILFTLEAQRFIRKEGKRYVLGSALIHLGNKAQNTLSIRELAGPVLNKLTDFTQETSHLAILSSNKTLILEVCDSPHPLSAHSRQGTMADLHCSATGKTMLAFMKPEDLDSTLDQIDYLVRTPHTLANKKDLRVELGNIRNRGYSIDEEEYHPGIRCIAAPVFDAHGVVAYSIGITASIFRFTKSKINPYANYLVRLAGELTISIGGQFPR